MTFLLGTTALAIDADWLDYSMTPQQFGKQECPSQPVERESVYFHRSVLDLLNIGGHLWSSIQTGFYPGLTSFNSELQTFPAPADHIQGPPVETLIEMHKVNGRGREYDIRYRSPDERMAGIIRILCVDDNVNRVCVEPNGRFAGLTVYYSVSQDQFPAPDEVSTDPSTESGAILQFDQRLRGWLIDLEHPR